MSIKTEAAPNKHGGFRPGKFNGFSISHVPKTPGGQQDTPVPKCRFPFGFNHVQFPFIYLIGERV